MRRSGCLVLTLLSRPMTVLAEEGGTGHYMPGSMASFIDGVPGNETLVSRLNVVDYDGSIDGSAAIPIAGRTAFGADVGKRGYALATVWPPPLDLGENWRYAAGVTVP